MGSSLHIENIDAGYGAVTVLSNVAVDVRDGETVVMLGTNGNGKSTLMRCITGEVVPTKGRITAEIDGVTHDLVGRATERSSISALRLVPEGRRLFPKLTVEENLLLGAFREGARPQINDNLYFASTHSRVLPNAGASSRHR